MIMKGALSLAECKPEYKVVCTLILNNGRSKLNNAAALPEPGEARPAPKSLSS